ncbi:MAG: dynamin family protein [Acidimicrobiia bacterium]
MFGRDNTALDALRQVCDDALSRLVDGPGRSMVASVRTKLDVPLTVTVAGGVSSGKSTLVNALLAQKIAAVDTGECTRVVTEFRYGVHERAEVIGTDGTRSMLLLDRGRLPDQLGRPIEQVSSIVVHLSNALLKDLAVVDTPGLNTVSEHNETTTSDFLGVSGREGEHTAGAVSRADALLFLLPVLRQSDAAVLQGFAKLFGGSGLSAASTIAVLSKIDRLGRTPDPVGQVQPMVQRMASDLRGVVGDVLPVIGLLAETSRAAVFTEADARAVHAVAAVRDEFDREDMLLSAEDFLRFPGLDLTPGERQRLLTLLDVHGLTVAIGAIDRGARSAGDLLRFLEEHSGFGALRAVVMDRFADQAALFKAHAAIGDLRRASYLRDDPDNARALRALRTPLERLELDSTLHRLRLLEVAHAVAAGELTLPAELLDDVSALVSRSSLESAIGANTNNAAARALEGAARWGTWGNDARRSPAEARMARVVKEAFEVLWSQFDGSRDE